MATTMARSSSAGASSTARERSMSSPIPHCPASGSRTRTSSGITSRSLPCCPGDGAMGCASAPQCTPRSCTAERGSFSRAGLVFPTAYVVSPDLEVTAVNDGDRAPSIKPSSVPPEQSRISSTTLSGGVTSPSSHAMPSPQLEDIGHPAENVGVAAERGNDPRLSLFPTLRSAYRHRRIMPLLVASGVGWASVLSLDRRARRMPRFLRRCPISAEAVPLVQA